MQKYSINLREDAEAIGNIIMGGYTYCCNKTVSDIMGNMSKPLSSAIRLTRTPEVAHALTLAKRRYPTLSDPEILKVGLAKLTRLSEEDEIEEIRLAASYSVGVDYLSDPEEDIYHTGMGKKLPWTK